ncbi:MAG: ABC transporter permease [Alphaproteobacteria bacterium CG_4_10_14_0_2_um_filter_63_37]|nr:MAG: ABC transporter permease [Proteobacteria bacterium CG1_02_64_396]PJA24869.1 MAG: ABC transporter permease [Alphaproteobacteria bacterium CG_4_10_14_0_2_um_filter_63_37]
MNMLPLALRGLTRNRRRSLTTLSAIAVGFAAVTLFAGYIHNIFGGLAAQSIHGELLGHLTLSLRGLDKEGRFDPERYLLHEDDIAKIEALLEADPQVTLVTPRLALSGIAANGRVSTIFIAEGIDPDDGWRIQAPAAALRDSLGLEDSGIPEQLAVEGLDAARPDGVTLGRDLAGLLDLKRGDIGVVLVNTVGGQANALDFSVGGIFDTGNAGTNDKMMFMPIELARTLYDLPGGADRLTVLLDDVKHTAQARDRIEKVLNGAGFDVEVKTWQTLSAFYRQVKGMFEMIFGFIALIVLTVVVMSTASAMGMTVVERTREIGTLRAIGLKRGKVVRLFVLESFLLTLLGCATGLLLAYLTRYGVNAAHISYIPPNATAPVPLRVDFDAARAWWTLALMLVVGSAAAWLPARRAARQPIIEALGHV